MYSKIKFITHRDIFCRHIMALILAGVATAGGTLIEPTNNRAVVHLYSGSFHSGYHELELFPNDIERITSYHRSRHRVKPQTRLTEGQLLGGDSRSKRGKQRKTRQLRAGAFIAARDHILSNPINMMKLRKDKKCMDYGSDVVSYKDANNDVTYVSFCPNEFVLKLYSETKDIIAGYDPGSKP